MKDMMKVKIISIGYSVPEFSYTQEEMFRELGYPEAHWKLFARSQIKKRHFALPISKAKKLSFQEQQEEYQRRAPLLSKKALLNSLDGRDPKILGLIAYSTCTGFPPGPTVPHYLIKELGLNPSIETTNISSHGCEAAFPGLRRAYDFTRATGEVSAAIACELCSLTYFPENPSPDPENDYELMRGYSIFGDACSSIIVGADTDPRHPEILDFNTCVDLNFFDALGYIWREGRLRLRLSRKVPKVATYLMGKAVVGLLDRNNLKVKDISHWVIHPAGAIIIDMIRDNLGIEEEKLKYSREALAQYGNTSSASVGIVAKLLMRHERNPQGYLVMANAGPGMIANAVLLRFGKG